MDDFLGKKGLLIERQHDTVGYDIIDKVDAHRSRIAKVVDLDRRRTISEDVRATILGIALEIDGDVHLKVMEELRDIAIRRLPFIVKLVERLDEARPQVALIVNPEGYAHHLKACSVVKFK